MPGPHPHNIFEGHTVVVDLLACAHASPISNPEEPSSWVWNPYRTTGGIESTNNRPSPYGIGARRCPAGKLSVYLAGAALEALFDWGLSWQLVNMQDSTKSRPSAPACCGYMKSSATPGPDPDAQKLLPGWLRHVSYNRTFGLNRAVDLVFEVPSS